MNEDRCQCRIIHDDKVAYAKERDLPAEELEELVLFFRKYSDVSRLRILFALRDQEMCVCDIAAFLGVTESAASHQLRYLRSVHLVKNRREGTILYYRLVDDAMLSVVQTCCEMLFAKKKTKE